MTVSQAAAAAGVAKDTISVCYECCLRVCSATESVLQKMSGTHCEPIQADESYFAGRRKYNRGHFRSGDRRPREDAAARAELDI